MEKTRGVVEGGRAWWWWWWREQRAGSREWPHHHEADMEGGCPHVVPATWIGDCGARPSDSLARIEPRWSLVGIEAHGLRSQGGTRGARERIDAL
jgi:hypothetical protein